MLARTPRRFRSKVLLAIFLSGIALLSVTYYFPYSENNVTRHAEDLSPSPSWWHRLFAPLETCKEITHKPSPNILKTGDVYPNLDFGVPDNQAIGFWNEELETRYREIRTNWKNLSLEVIVVPHSHVDPGWLRTYDDYFMNSVTHILDNMVTFLNKTEDFKFVWSEITYFADWWKKQKEDVRETVKKILKRKQLEILTGGWVMTDEATTSYFAIIDQLIEGHQWLNHFTGTKPEHGWSIDVFGHSASIPYILSEAGISETVILRTHYSWKAYLAKARSFDFYWEQPFDSSKVLCHMAPSDLYSFKHTCGPDPFSCLKYDFRRVGGEYSESTADDITDSNVELKASYLLAQYGRYASLYNHNVLLVPLGDDFRYNLYMEWNQQYYNYKKLFDFINNKEDWYAHVKFGTVADYFDLVNQRLDHNINNISIPSISGDFFPYADIYANFRPSYWTGYYSTRPFYKKLSQELEHWLRSSEILYSLTKTFTNSSLGQQFMKDYLLLISARTKLALFQHHDAITGTSKEYVMKDYGEKLHSAIIDAMSVTSHIAQMLLMEKNYDETTWTSQVYPDAYRPSRDFQTKKLSISVPNEGRRIILFNSLTVKRSEIIRLKVRTADLIVLDSNGEQVASQINPTWKSPFVMSNSVFELVFVADMKPLSLSTYTLKKSTSKEIKKSVISLLLKDDSTTTLSHSIFNFESQINKDLYLESPHFRAAFSPSGILKEIYMKKTGISKLINLDFRAYVPKEHHSGAYLFEPELNNPFYLNNFTDHYPLMCIVRGPVMSEMIIVYHDFLKVTLRVFNFKTSPAGIQVEVSPDISKIGKDVELVMRISSEINNNGEFFTDSNGLQMLKRKYVSKLPVQGNYYPATSALYIEDTSYRLSVLTPYCHGVTSPERGTIELMLDRRMRTDDSRGMGEGVRDNRLISTTYWLIMEGTLKEETSPVLSQETHLLSLRLQYPLITLVTDNGEARITKPHVSLLSEYWPDNVHLVNLRTLPQKEDYEKPSSKSLMLIHEKFDSCKGKNFIQEIVFEKNKALFSKVKINSIVKTSLTGTIDFDEENSISGATSTTKLQTYIVSLR